MPIDDYHFRPITFEGEMFPATLMGISILDLLEGLNEDVAEWLWLLPICKGVTKHAPAEHCAHCARTAADLMLEQRQRVLDGILERLASYGFDPETTYRDWLLALQRIAELSATAEDECFWSAPAHPRDKIRSKDDMQRFLDAIEKKFDSGESEP